MSSSPIERDLVAPGVAGPGPPSTTTSFAVDRPAASRRNLIKRALPRSLFGRSLLIIVTPLVLLQIISTWIFYDRHWETVARRLAGGVAGDIAMTVETMTMLSPVDRSRIFRLAGDLNPPLPPRSAARAR